jgi:indole-3-glycerol phosphate synthase
MKESKNSNARKCSNALWNKKSTGKTPVITDIKIKSPGEGDLILRRDPVSLCKSLEEAGVPMISVVTEAEHYGGSLELLNRIVKAVSVPVLRKDFISKREQLVETVENGASGVLLIASMLEKEQLFRLVEDSLALGLEPLVETHNESEIISVRELELTFVGINNRNIIQLETDGGNVNTTEKLAALAPREALLVSESSISSKADVSRAIVAGAHAVLVGTAILKAEDPVQMYKKLSETLGEEL